MARTYLQTNTVNHNHQTGSYENIERELIKEQQYLNAQLARVSADILSGEGDDAALNAEQASYRQALDTAVQDMALLKKYPESFPYLYSVREHAKADEMQGTFREVLSDDAEIVTEAGDVMPRDEALELNYEIDGVPFAVSAEPYDKPGEDEAQLRGRINFSVKAIENLNEERLKQILAFCEQHGMSVYDIDIPMKEGKVDLDEKLASLMQKVMDARRAQDAANPGAGADDENLNHYQEITPETKDLDVAFVKGTKVKPPKTLNNVKNDLLELIEKDMKKTRGLTFFERTRNVGGLSTTVFSIYDKPDKDNEKKDGLKDKNGVYVPTYTYRLYVSQNSKTGRFVFGYSTPNGKKLDDAMAGDFIGVIKKSGATHVNFSNLSNADKGVWMMACAEKGLVPIGISINMAKAKAMVEAARKKLNHEEFVLFKKRLADQMIENSEKKNPGKARFGMEKSEYDFVQTMRSGYDFENFRSAYDAEGGLYTTVLSRIEEGGANAEKGAAITFGAMRALRSVFDLYVKNQNETFGEALAKSTGANNKYALTKEEVLALSQIPAGKPMMDLNTDDFMAIYRVLEPRQIRQAEEDILAAYRRELKRKPQRADTIVLASDLFPKVKSEVNGINIYLGREGIDTLTLPNEHSGLSYARPEELNPQPTAQNTQVLQNTQTNQPQATNKVVNAQVQNSGNTR